MLIKSFKTEINSGIGMNFNKVNQSYSATFEKQITIREFIMIYESDRNK
jgi:hypothetical protein